MPVHFKLFAPECARPRAQQHWPRVFTEQFWLFETAAPEDGRTPDSLNVANLRIMPRELPGPDPHPVARKPCAGQSDNGRLKGSRSLAVNPGDSRGIMRRLATLSES